AKSSPIVHGLDVGPQTKCLHWHSDLDIIAIRHKCCKTYYACISCHEAQADHPPKVWSKGERDEKAILCGNCKVELTITQYLNSGNQCPTCSAAFNPGCSMHYDLYFE
ncbi:zinc finger CHY domain-containing protein [SL153], partial [Dactylonectria macrodidyma]